MMGDAGRLGSLLLLAAVGAAAFAAGRWSAPAAPWGSSASAGGGGGGPAGAQGGLQRLTARQLVGGRAGGAGAGAEHVAMAAAGGEAPPILEPTQFAPAFPDAPPPPPGAPPPSPGQLLGQEVAFLRRRVHDLRLLYGAAHCAAHGIGPSGGFCLTSREPGTASGSLLDAPLCAALGALTAGRSVADLGAGRGQYGACLRPHVRLYAPYDGSEGIEAATNRSVTFLDLSVPTWLGRGFDWVMSLEVGEHLPAASEDVFIANLLRHVAAPALRGAAPRAAAGGQAAAGAAAGAGASGGADGGGAGGGGGGLVLSWAVPGQGGHHHVNERPNEHVVERVTALSRGALRLNASASAALRLASSLPWFRNTVMVFDRI
ncbi:hypothetical protein HYH03_013552 [Edaphochlamys debaryana]|uniref:Methyltransferase type 11 domain-containing protein n=1 Tax=Edaphochlamys debaryana TaxID=47281 RepID=A0A835XW03_9CHLO|nr:hypothetical protein HYH03_013552 [Edaphochlamys debaryana]|eukprot:KAG2487835.1 hypothetical protein HYH03_013552 [Edaphochlamys debaryana]